MNGLQYQYSEGDSYWRFQASYKLRGQKGRYRKHLESKGYNPKKSASWRDLDKLMLRVNLELPCYDACTEQEISKFCIDRGLVPANSRLARSTLTKKLLEADTVPEFCRFPDLPPEIRTRVYELYMLDFKRGDGTVEDALRHPTQPPLTRTTQIIRAESLPMFYSMCIFELQSKMGQSNKVEMDDRSDRWLRSIGDQNIGDIRCFELHCSPTDWFSFDSTVVNISMDPAGTNFSLYTGLRSTWYGWGELRDDIKAGISDIMQAVAQREGLSKLKHGDFEKILALYS